MNPFAGFLYQEGKKRMTEKSSGINQEDAPSGRLSTARSRAPVTSAPSPMPPTDTERFDWLEKMGVAFRWTELDGFLDDKWQIKQTIGTPPIVLGAGDTLREAVDDAMGKRREYWFDHCPSCGAETPNSYEDRCEKCKHNRASA